jgi:hypothetical protein
MNWSGPEVMSGLLALVRTEVRACLAEDRARPELVHQRNVEAVVGLPARDYLRLARAGAFACVKDRRLVIARTDDVLAVFERRMAVPGPNDTADAEARALSRVGGRRVG